MGNDMLPYEIDYRALPFPKLALCTNKRQFQRLIRTLNITPQPK